MITEKQVGIAAKLYEARSAMRGLFAEKYPEKMAEYRKHIEQWMEPEDNGSPIPATMKLVEKLQAMLPYGSGITQSLLLAACVEMIEPTPA